MKEDLNLYGNQYNYIIVAWTVGYIVGQWVRILVSSH
jgi:ACS family pantothenate transporter-like MFS transporter